MALQTIFPWLLVLYTSGVIAQGLTNSSTTRIETPKPTDPQITPPPQLEPSLASCWSSYNDWRNYISYTKYNWEPVFYTLNYSRSIISLSSTNSVAMTTLCDGIPRALSRSSTSFWRSTTTFLNASETTYSINYSTLPYTISQPTCTVADNSEECEEMWGVWASTSSAYSARYTPYVQPPCYMSREVEGCPRPGSERRCIVDSLNPAAVSLLYWPVTTVSGDFCSQNGSTITPTPTARDGSPNTIVYEDATFTSPSAYLMMYAAAAYYSSSGRSNWHWCGHTPTRLTLELEPTDVSSVRYPAGRIYRGEKPTSFSFNWADLNTVPAEAWKRLHHNKSIEYINYGYTPAVAVPTQITQYNPEWAGCTGRGILDPILIPLGVTSSVSSLAPAPTPSMVITSAPTATKSMEADYTALQRYSA